uniref:cAMP-dependent protein kinase inhibitor gamma n=2 Tax=Ficedula albicollis TaxID=59894 RepID=A0A803V6C2_FICAL
MDPSCLPALTWHSGSPSMEPNAVSAFAEHLGWILPAYLPSPGTVGHPAWLLQVDRDAMEVESSTYTDFISCDRAGRRNAVHDIQREATTISMRKLAEDMGELAVQGAESQRDASSSDNDPGARPKGQESSPSP